MPRIQHEESQQQNERPTKTNSNEKEVQKRRRKLSRNLIKFLSIFIVLNFATVYGIEQIVQFITWSIQMQNLPLIYLFS